MAYVIADMRCIQTNHPQAAISLHVDDLTLQITGEGVQNIVDNTMAMAEEVIDRFENNLGLPFDTKKAQLTSASKEVATIVHRRLAKRAGNITNTTIKLGIETAIKGRFRRILAQKTGPTLAGSKEQSR